MPVRFPRTLRSWIKITTAAIMKKTVPKSKKSISSRSTAVPASLELRSTQFSRPTSLSAYRTHGRRIQIKLRSYYLCMMAPVEAAVQLETGSRIALSTPFAHCLAAGRSRSLRHGGTRDRRLVDHRPDNPDGASRLHPASHSRVWRPAARSLRDGCRARPGTRACQWRNDPLRRRAFASARLPHRYRRHPPVDSSGREAVWRLVKGRIRIFTNVGEEGGHARAGHGAQTSISIRKTTPPRRIQNHPGGGSSATNNRLAVSAGP